MTRKQFGTGMVSWVEALSDTASPWNYPRHRRVEFRINAPTMLPSYRVNPDAITIFLPFWLAKCARKGLSHCDIFIRQAEDSRENKVDFRYSRRPRGFSPQQSYARARFVTVTRLLELSKLTGICGVSKAHSNLVRSHGHLRLENASRPCASRHRHNVSKV